MEDTDFDALDYSNPAALLQVLRPAYYRLLTGSAEEEIEGTDRRRARFQKGDIPRLERLINELEAKVAGRRRRYALVGRMR
jgi:hypothetical protein